jgi:hypothetical protein
MLSDGSVTHWIAAIKEGSAAAAEGIWSRYFPRLVRLARRQTRGISRSVADEEDVARLDAAMVVCGTRGNQKKVCVLHLCAGKRPWRSRQRSARKWTRSREHFGKHSYTGWNPAHPLASIVKCQELTPHPKNNPR